MLNGSAIATRERVERAEEVLLVYLAVELPPIPAPGKSHWAQKEKQEAEPHRSGPTLQDEARRHSSSAFHIGYEGVSNATYICCVLMCEPMIG